MPWVAFCLAYAGFAALSMAMPRHYEEAFDLALTPLRQRGLRFLGIVLLGMSLWLCAHLMGWSYGATLWIGLLSAAGLLLIWMLAYRPRVAYLLALFSMAMTPLLAWVAAR